MITTDFILRQIHQLSQVLAVVLFGKQRGELEQAQQTLAEGLEAVLGMPLADLHGLSREEVLAVCRNGETFSSEKALAVADLFREDGSTEGRQRALWLYEAVDEAGDIAPLDLPERIAALRVPE